MALVIPPGYANLTLTVTNGSGGASSRNSISFGLEQPGALTQADVARIANICRDALTPLLDNSWLLGPTHIVENSSGVMKVWDDSGTEAGTHSAVAYCPPAVAFVVSKATGLAGRSHRGRVYWPGVEEAAVSEDGVLGGGTVNAVTAAFEDLRADLEADAAVVHMALLHDEDTPGALPPDTIVSLFCRNVVGTMRPRQRR